MPLLMAANPYSEHLQLLGAVVTRYFQIILELNWLFQNDKIKKLQDVKQDTQDVQYSVFIPGSFSSNSHLNIGAPKASPHPNSSYSFIHLGNIY